MCENKKFLQMKIKEKKIGIIKRIKKGKILNPIPNLRLSDRTKN